MLGFLGRLLLGNGTLRPEMKAALEAEGAVLIEEGLGGSVRYRRFRAPGKRFHGKVTGERMGLGISRRRLVVYCRSGRGKLIDTEFASPRWEMIGVSAKDGERVIFHIDYSKQDEDPRVAGEIAIHVKTPEAERIAGEITSRVAAAAR